MVFSGRARHPCPGRDIELVDVGGWMSNCDEVIDTKTDFLVLTEHRLIPARVRAEGKRLRSRNVASLWTPACQESSHVDHAGVGLVSLRGASLTPAAPCTGDFKSFGRLGRALRCLIPVGEGGVMHLVVVYGFQGAGGDSDKLTLTDGDV